MISLKATILIGIGCFILGGLCGVFCTTLCIAKKKFEEELKINKMKKKILIGS